VFRLPLYKRYIRIRQACCQVSKYERDNNRSKEKEFVMRFKEIVIAAEDLECDEIDTIYDTIKKHILDVGIATPTTLTGFSWRLDVRMRMDNDDT